MDIGGSRLSLKKELREGTLDTSHAAFIGRLDLNTERLCRGGVCWEQRPSANPTRLKREDFFSACDMDCGTWE